MRKVLTIIFGLALLTQMFPSLRTTLDPTLGDMDTASVVFLAAKVLLVWAVFRTVKNGIGGLLRGTKRLVTGPSAVARAERRNRERMLASTGVQRRTGRTARVNHPAPALAPASNVVPFRPYSANVPLHPADMYPTGSHFPAFHGSADMVNEQTPADVLSALYAFANSDQDDTTDWRHDTTSIPAVA